MKAVKYGTKSCGMCNVTEKNLKASGVEFEVVDMNIDKGAMEREGIRTIPTVDFFNDNGEKICRKTGLLTVQDIKEIIEA